MTRNKRHGFTLVELLVVIAIIGILVGLLLPAVQAAREAARRMSCSNNLKQMGLALHNYESAQKSFPIGLNYRGLHDGDATDGTGGSGYGWGFALLPYLEQAPLFEQFNQRYVIMEKTITRNGILCATPLSVFSCPSATKPETRNDGAIQPSATSSYQGAGSPYDAFNSASGTSAGNSTRNSGFFELNTRETTKFSSLTDGSSNQFAIAEARWRADSGCNNRSRIYGSSDNVLFATGAVNAILVTGIYRMNWYNCPVDLANPWPHRTAGSQHTGGAQFVFGDGSVHFISDSIDHTSTTWDSTRPHRNPDGTPFGTFQRLFSRDDGNTVNFLN